MGHNHDAKIEYCADASGLNIVWRRFVCSCGDSSDWELDESYTLDDVGLVDSFQNKR